MPLKNDQGVILKHYKTRVDVLELKVKIMEHDLNVAKRQKIEHDAAKWMLIPTKVNLQTMSDDEQKKWKKEVNSIFDKEKELFQWKCEYCSKWFNSLGNHNKHKFGVKDQPPQCPKVRDLMDQHLEKDEKFIISRAQPEKRKRPEPKIDALKNMPEIKQEIKEEIKDEPE